MLIKVDAAQLEWRVKVFLAQDQVAIAEILDPTRDIHQENKDLFVLPNRTVAKNFLYRMIFADAFGDKGFEGPAYAYANDPNFSPTSTSISFWAGVIERFFKKYDGIFKHSVSIIREGVETGYIHSPSGRAYPYRPYVGRNGTPDWPRTNMLNHIVQGLSADFMILARKYIYKHWDTAYGLLINTVHDDIEADCYNNVGTLYDVSCLMENAFLAISSLAKTWFNIDLNVPMKGEVKLGYTLEESSMFKFNKQSFEEDYNNYVKNFSIRSA